MVKAGLGSRSSKHWSVDHSQLVTNQELGLDSRLGLYFLLASPDAQPVWGTTGVGGTGI